MTFKGNFDHDGGWLGSQKFSNQDFGWDTVICGQFDEFTDIIGLIINLLAFGTPLLSFRDTSSYIYIYMSPFEDEAKNVNL